MPGQEPCGQRWWLSDVSVTFDVLDSALCLAPRLRPCEADSLSAERDCRRKYWSH